MAALLTVLLVLLGAFALSQGAAVKSGRQLKDFVTLLQQNIYRPVTPYKIPEITKTVRTETIALFHISQDVNPGTPGHNATHMTMPLNAVFIGADFDITGRCEGSIYALAKGTFTIPFKFDAATGMIQTSTTKTRYTDQNTFMIHSWDFGAWWDIPDWLIAYSQSYIYGGYETVINKVLADTVAQFNNQASTASFLPKHISVA